MGYSAMSNERAREIGDPPHVKKWIRWFQKLAKDIPPEVWVFVGAGIPAILARDKDGSKGKRRDGVVLSEYEIDHVSGGFGQWDGGGY